jgi:transglutaminase-like putative cysteine protease
MSVTVALHHTTRYRYSRPAGLSPQTIRLRPSPHCRTPIPSYSLMIKPACHSLHWIQDPQGNYLARVIFSAPVSEFIVDVRLVADLVPLNPFNFFVEDYAANFPFSYDATVQDELAPYLKRAVDTGDHWDQFLLDVDTRPRQTIHFLVELNRLVNRAITYSVRMEPGIQTPEFTLANHTGSCRDSTWLLINALRHFGLAARFVSGYLIQLKARQPSDGPEPGPIEDGADLHAWAEVYLPGAGWIGLDPTSGLLSAEGHIPLASSPNQVSAAPITGSAESVETEFFFSMMVARCSMPPA